MNTAPTISKSYQKIIVKGGNLMWNSKWEYENQAYLKERYEKKCRANCRIILSERSSARGAAESFIRTSKPKSIAFMVCAAIADIKRNCLRSGLKLVKTVFVRFAARYLHPKDRTASTAPTLADRKPTAKALRLGKWSF